MADTLQKQPAESRLYTMDFSPKLASGDTIASIVSVDEFTVPESGPDTVSTDLTIGAPTFSGTSGQVRISSGNDDVTYKLQWTATTTNGDTLQAEGYLYVKDF